MPGKTKMRTRTRQTRTRQTKTKTKTRKHKQKMYYMKGCNTKCKSNKNKNRNRNKKINGGSEPIGGLKINGGNHKNMRGGSMMPENLLTALRGMYYQGESIYNGLGGYRAPTNPLPYDQTRV